MRPKSSGRSRFNHHYSKGFSLIEVLVTIVVLSIGLLGLAGLQATAIKNSYASYQRSLANLQTQDAVERLWANRCAIKGSNVLSTVKTEWQTAHTQTTTKLAMPGWSGNITGTENTTEPIGSYNITISWSERSTLQGVTGATQTFSHAVNIPFLNCP